MKAIWTLKGLGGFYKGLVPTLLRDVPEVAIQFTVYEALRKVRDHPHPAQHGTPARCAQQSRLICGGGGAAAATVCAAGASRAKAADV